MMRAAPTILLALWLSAVTVLGGTLLTRHAASLPAPARLTADFAVYRDPSSERLGVYHVLAASCRCSQQIARRLATSTRPAGVDEHVLIVGDTDRSFRGVFEGRPFTLHDVPEADLAKLGIPAVPLLLVVVGDEVRYSGGYTERKQGLVVRDLELIELVRRGERPAPLPLFGCAVDEKLRRERNPLRIP